MEETARSCTYCGGAEDEHAEGCPEGAAVHVVCGMCGNDVLLAHLHDHLRLEHEVEPPPQDLLESSFVELRHAVEQMARRPFSARDAYPGFTRTKILAAVGEKTATGRWPEAFDVEGALLFTVDWLEEYRRLLRAHHRAQGNGCGICTAERGRDA